MAVEPQTAALAALRRSEAELHDMRASLARMEAAASDAPAFAEADLTLHLAVAGASGNRFMHALGAVIEAALRGRAPMPPQQFPASAPPTIKVRDQTPAQLCGGDHRPR